MAISLNSQFISRVLLVEDNLLAQLAAKSILLSLDLKLDAASCGSEALGLANTHSYDLILMDIGLGDLTGFEVARQIRSNSPLNKKTPIYALTGQEEINEPLTSYGINGYIIKPMTREILDGVLKELNYV